MAITGEAYFLANPAMRNLYYTKKVAKNGNIVQPDNWDLLDDDEALSLLFCPGGVRRVLNWMSTKQFKEHMARNEPFLCDVDQNPPHAGGKSQGGLLWPSQLTHGHIMCFKQGTSPRSWRLAVPQEHLQAMGFNLLCRETPFSAIKHALDNLQIGADSLKRVSGNSMYVKTQAAWMWYFLGHIAPCHKHLYRALGAPDSEWDDEF